MLLAVASCLEGMAFTARKLNSHTHPQQSGENREGGSTTSVHPPTAAGWQAAGARRCKATAILEAVLSESRKRFLQPESVPERLAMPAVQCAPSRGVPCGGFGGIQEDYCSGSVVDEAADDAASRAAAIAEAVNGIVVAATEDTCGQLPGKQILKEEPAGPVSCQLRPAAGRVRSPGSCPAAARSFSATAHSFPAAGPSFPAAAHSCLGSNPCSASEGGCALPEACPSDPPPPLPPWVHALDALLAEEEVAAALVRGYTLEDFARETVRFVKDAAVILSR